MLLVVAKMLGGYCRSYDTPDILRHRLVSCPNGPRYASSYKPKTIEVQLNHVGRAKHEGGGLP
jgi:hypothetical protein